MWNTILWRFACFARWFFVLQHYTEQSTCMQKICCTNLPTDVNKKLPSLRENKKCHDEEEIL